MVGERVMSLLVVVLIGITAAAAQCKLYGFALALTGAVVIAGWVWGAQNR